MTVAPYTLSLFPPPSRLNGAPLLPRPRPHIRRRVAVKVSASWLPASGDPDDGIGGWRVPEPPVERERRNGIGRAMAVVLGASAAIGLARLAWCSPSSRKCLQQVIDSSLHYVQEKMSTLESQEAPKEDSCERESDENEASISILDEEAEAITAESRQIHRLNGVTHVLFSVTIDPLHEEAFSILKKLQRTRDHHHVMRACSWVALVWRRHWNSPYWYAAGGHKYIYVVSKPSQQKCGGLQHKKIVKPTKIFDGKCSTKLMKKFVNCRYRGADNNNIIHIDEDINLNTSLIKDEERKEYTTQSRKPGARGGGRGKAIE